MQAASPQQSGWTKQLHVDGKTTGTTWAHEAVLDVEARTVRKEILTRPI